MADEVMNNETQTVETDNNEAQETYTKEEVLKLIQSESDKRVTQALKTQKEKIDKEKSLSGLDKEQREKAETNEKIRALEAQLKDMTTLQNKQEVIKVLTNRKLNPQFADLISIGENAEEAIEKIDVLEKMFKDAVQEEVKSRLAANGGSIKDSGLPTGEITKEEFNRMTIAQQAELYNTDPELYKKLSK